LFYPDCEADTIVGTRQQGYLVSLTERRSRLVLLGRVADRCADTVGRMMVRLLRPIRHRVLTITSDNGTEFAGHEAVARELEADFFFAHPYSAWERGTNENANGLVRRYFPKGTNFLNVSDAEVRHVMNRLNDRPRRILGCRTPARPIGIGASRRLPRRLLPPTFDEFGRLPAERPNPPVRSSRPVHNCFSCLA